ncbi:MAG: histidine ammonia-lyase [Beijerinckiaceae bacterium]
MTTLELGNGPLNLKIIAAAAKPGTQLSLSPSASQRLASARAVVDRYASGDEPIYGLNTGLGGNVGFRLSRSEIEAFQVQMIRGRCIGVGEAFTEQVARTMLLSRLIGLAQGGSGISPAVFELMLAMFNRGLTPVIPARGSIGAGDLGLCAHIGAAVIGEGEIFVRGERRPAAEALRSAGLAPARLGPKDGLAILNSSAVSCGHASVVLAALAQLLSLSVVTAMLTDEGYAANPRIFDADLAAARPAGGQERAAAMFRAVLGGSYLYDSGAPRSIQDALSFRVLSQIYGPVLTSFETAVESVGIEINSAADNPLVMAEAGLILSTANFHTPTMALAFDTLAIVNTHLATASAYRTTKMMNQHLSGLPKYLSPIGGAANGFNSLQKTVACLHGEVRLKATPASLDCLPVSESVEDHAPQTPLTIRKLEEQLAPLRLMIAIEALVAAQAVDLRNRPRLAPATQILFDAIRHRVPMLIEDRATGADVDQINALFQSPSFFQTLEKSLSTLKHWPTALLST